MLRHFRNSGRKTELEMPIRGVLMDRRDFLKAVGGAMACLAIRAAAQGDASAKKLYDKYHHRPAEELYLVDEDPWEMNNLADEPRYAEAKRRLLAELRRWMAEQKDPGAAMDDPEVHAANRKAGGRKPR